ncbi:OLC1v1010421C2 [Oldenlandia corymbosa var. corymbosa]|nr:OLC1v1010421C2 [Oldenlandia corymbosa var. corymbosa]
MKIDAPAIEYLFLEGEASQKLSLEGLTSLREAELNLVHDWGEEVRSTNLMVELVESLHCAVEFLTLSYLTSAALKCATTRLSARFERLTKLSIELPYNGWNFLKDLLGCAMELKVLDLRSLSRCEEEHITCWKEPMCVPECPLYSLAFSISILTFGISHTVIDLFSPSPSSLGFSSANPVDGISELPDSILCYILSFIPTKFVVGTSVLSKRWKSMWTGVNTLDFDDDLLHNGSCYKEGEERPAFVEFVNNVLIQHKSETVQTFHPSWKNQCNPVQVERWMKDAIACNVKILDLHVQEPEDYEDYDGSEEIPIKIDAPALKHLFLQDHGSQKLSLQGLSSLSEAELDLGDRENCWGYDTDYTNAFVNVVQSVHCTEFLKLSLSTSAALNFSRTRFKSATFDRLSKLYIDCLCCGWRFLKDLLHCAKKLQVLEITKCSSHDKKHKPCWRKPREIPKCLLYRLDHVSLRGFQSLKDEVKLIKYILRHGSVMRKINVYSSAAANDFKTRYLILQGLLMFQLPRASSSCRIKHS